MINTQLKNSARLSQLMRWTRIFLIIGLLLGMLGLVTLMAQVGTGSPNPAPRNSGERQELSVRGQIEREGYEQPYGKTDNEIRANLKIEGKTADVVGYNRQTDRWLVAESKGGDIDSAYNQLKNTVKFLTRNNPQIEVGRIDLRIYTNAQQYARLSEADIAGWRISSQSQLGWVGEANEWLFADVEGINILVFLAP